MPWGLWSSSSRADDKPKLSTNTSRDAEHTPLHLPAALGGSSKEKKLDWRDAKDYVASHIVEPRGWTPVLVTAAVAVGVLQFYRSYLRRLPGTGYVSPNLFNKRTLLGKVTSVGDGDNFHFFHTPGGKLAGWGWLRKVPEARKEIKGQTIPIRLAGIDAPEGAHFGRPAQPFAAEALEFLQGYVLGRTVRARIYKRDQYERIVATVFVRRPPLFVPRRDVGLEMLRRGLATTYEAKTGVEFGGEKAERKYRAAEEDARKRGRGMWAAERRGGGLFGLGRATTELESPRAFKDRMKAAERDKGK